METARNGSKAYVLRGKFFDAVRHVVTPACSNGTFQIVVLWLYLLSLVRLLRLVKMWLIGIF